MSLPIAAVAAKAPAVAGRKKRSGALDAIPRLVPTSTPSATAVSSSRPDTPPARSAWAVAAASSTAIGWTTARSWMQSNSELWIW